MYSSSGSSIIPVPAAEWREQRERHIERVRVYTSDRVARSSRAVPHPVYDFLFTYYAFRPAHLERWSPGFGVVLADCEGAEIDWADATVRIPAGWTIPAASFPQHRLKYLDWCIRYLTNITERPPHFSCFGLHEWAMVYSCETVRHSQVPLRVSPAKIKEVVHALGLRCTHYDAYRFFTPEAVPLNRDALSREATPDFDQRACIHVTMDLYRFAHKIAPWCPSDLIADSFLLAADARRIDMRASPYDLTSHGFAPIFIETPEGRQEYLGEQRRLADAAIPVRQRLLDVYTRLANAAREPVSSDGEARLG